MSVRSSRARPNARHSHQNQKGERRPKLSRLARLEKVRKNIRKNMHLNREPWPVVGAALAGSAGLAAAAAVGAAELAVGGALAYAAFRMLRDNRLTRQ